MKKPAVTVAVVVLVGVLVGVVGFSVYSATSGGAEEVVVVTPTPTLGDAGDSAVGSIDTGRFTSLDEEGRLEFIVEFAEVTPIDSVRSRVVAPVAKFFGPTRVVRVSAADGEFLWPSREERPESGRLAGGVTIELFPRDGDATDVSGAAIATLATETVRFQTLLGRLTTADAFTLTSASLDVSGVGLELRVSEASEQLQQLRIDRDLVATFDPSVGDDPAFGGASDGERAGRGSDGDGGAPGSADGTDGGDEVLYALRLNNDFVVSRGGLTVEADQAELFARLVGNRLPRDAVMPIATPVGGERVADAGGGEREPAAAEGAAGGAGSAGDQRITLRAAGPVVLNPVAAEATPELSADDVALVLRSPDTGTVRIADSAVGFETRAGSVRYGATSRRLSIRGVGGELGVSMTARTSRDGAARFLGGGVDLDLASGVGEVAGAGEVRLTDTGAGGANRVARVAWTERADMLFSVTQASGEEPSINVLRLSARGDIDATDGEARTPSRVTGDTLRADFRRVRADDDTDRRTVLSAIVVDGDATATRAPDPGDPTPRPTRIAAERFEARFVPDGDNGSRPQLAAAGASGGVEASLEGDRIAADAMDVAFDDGGGEIASGVAMGGVRVVTIEGQEIDADRLVFDATAQRLDATGSPARVAVFDAGVARPDLDDEPDEVPTRGVAIAAPSLRFFRAPARIESFGATAVSFALRDDSALSDPRVAADPARAIERGTIRCSQALLLDDRAGALELLGDVDITIERSARDERLVASADRLEIDYTPGRFAETDRVSGEPVVSASDILSARFVADDSGAASVEARRFGVARRADGAAGGERETVLLVNLSAPTIMASGSESTVTVPTGGELRVVDLRDVGGAPAGRDAEAASVANTDARGATIISWGGSMKLDGRIDAARLSRAVRVRHLHPDADTLTFLECEELTLFTATNSQNGLPPERTGDALGTIATAMTLERLEATGAVYARQDPVEIVADRAVYSQSTGLLETTAAAGNAVSLFDANNARAFSADAITLNLIEGTWSARGAAATTVGD